MFGSGDDGGTDDGDGGKGNREEEAGKGDDVEEQEEEGLDELEREKWKSLLRRGEEGGGEGEASASYMARAEGGAQALFSCLDVRDRGFAVVVKDEAGESILQGPIALWLMMMMGRNERLLIRA